MILTCPDCATRYFVDDARLGEDGRTVRCASCGATWRAYGEPEVQLLSSPEQSSFGSEPLAFRAPDPGAALPAPELPKAFRAKAQQKKRRRRAVAHGAIWAGIAGGFLGVLFAAWVFRVDVVRTFPRAAQAYAMAHVNATGLEFQEIKAEPSPVDPASVVVQGAVRNVTRKTAAVPLLRVALVDKAGVRMKSQILKLGVDQIAPGQTRGFITTLPDPKALAKDVDVGFALDVTPPQKPKPRPRVAPAAVKGAPKPAASPSTSSAPILRPALAPAAAPHDRSGLRALDTQAAKRVSPAPHG